MNILIISHNVISNYGNMGKTIKSMFPNIDELNLYQLYFRDEIPTINIRGEYFRITDFEVFKNMFSIRQLGNTISITETDKKISTGKKKNKKINKFVYNLGKERKHLNKIRDFMWKTNGNNFKRLNKWLENINLDVIFFAAGSSLFSINIAKYIKKKLEIPMLVYFGDNYRSFKDKHIIKPRTKFDYVFDSFFKLLDYYLTASNEMLDLYEQYYMKKGEVYYKPPEITNINKPLLSTKLNEGVYIGGLGLDRVTSLLKLSDLAKKSGIIINVFTPEISKKDKKRIINNGNIRLRGSLDPLQVSSEYQKYKYVVHVESYLPQYSNITMFSMSTKIPDLINSGATILIYAPKELSSVQYLLKNGRSIYLSKDFDSIIDEVSVLDKCDEINELNNYQVIEILQKMAKENIGTCVK